MKEVLSKEIDIKVDKRLMKEFRRYVLGIYTRDDDHVRFLANNVLGLHTPYFHTSDSNYLWDTILEVDKIELANEFHYPQTIVESSWEVAGNLMNNAMVWLIHLILVSKLNNRDQEAFVKEILILFQYKLLTSKIRRDWQHGANPATVAAAYDTLGGQFLIKQVDSWMEYFKLRADRMWNGDGEGKHKDMVGILRSYEDDYAVKNVISGLANNLATMIRAYNRIFYALHESGTGITSSSSIVMDSDGVDTVADSLSGFARYMRTLDSRIGRRDEFINDELMTVIVNETSARIRKVKELLLYVSDHYGDRDYMFVEDYVRNGVIFAFTELSNEGVVIDDIRSVVKLLLGKMSSRRNGNETFDNFEKYSTKILKKSIGNNKHGLSAKNVAIVYMVVWTLRTYKEM